MNLLQTPASTKRKDLLDESLNDFEFYVKFKENLDTS